MGDPSGTARSRLGLGPPLPSARNSVAPHATSLASAAAAGSADWPRADAGQRSAGAPGADPADRVAVVADEPLEAASRDHVVKGQVAAVLEGQGHGDAIVPPRGLRAGGACGYGTAHLDDRRRPTATEAWRQSAGRSSLGRHATCAALGERSGGRRRVLPTRWRQQRAAPVLPTPGGSPRRDFRVLTAPTRRSTRSASAAAHAHAHRRPSRRRGRRERSLPTSSVRGHAPRARTSPYRQCGHPAARPSTTYGPCWQPPARRPNTHAAANQVESSVARGTKGLLLPTGHAEGGASSLADHLVGATPLVAPLPTRPRRPARHRRRLPPLFVLAGPSPRQHRPRRPSGPAGRRPPGAHQPARPPARGDQPQEPRL